MTANLAFEEKGCLIFHLRYALACIAERLQLLLFAFLDCCKFDPCSCNQHFGSGKVI